MLTIDEAFAKFRGRQELTEREQADVSRRHSEVRAVVADGVHVERDFLSGSYARWTKTRPLKDVDIFCVLHEAERPYRNKPPRAVLDRFREILAGEYGDDRVEVDGMAVVVDFGIAVNADDETDDKVMSIEVVPAFPDGSHYEIPDASHGTWLRTDPEIHAQLAVKAHESYRHEWKPIVRMVKKWNRYQGGPINPSFLIEVMALQLLVPPFSGGYPYELKSFFASSAERIHEAWRDPAGLGPDVNGHQTQAQKNGAEEALRLAESMATRAILLARQGRNGDALRQWRDLFGPHFPLS